MPFFALVAWLDRAAVLREAEREARETIGIFHQHALNIFETHEVIAAWVREHIRGMSWDEIAGSAALHRYLAKIENDYLHVQALWLIDPAGRVRSASRVIPAPPVSVADRDYVGVLRPRDSGGVGRRIHAGDAPSPQFCLTSG